MINRDLLHLFSARTMILTKKILTNSSTLTRDISSERESIPEISKKEYLLC